jgi:hypothetical protein
MKAPPTFSAADPSYLVAASTSGSSSPTAATTAKGSDVSALSALVSSKQLS